MADTPIMERIKTREYTEKLSELNHPEKNVRVHGEYQVQELARSLKMFGQLRPVVVDENLTILAGNGLVMAAREAGFDKLKVLQITGLEQKEKLKLMLSDNRIYDLGSDDSDVIDDILQTLKGDLDIPGYDTEILEALMKESSEITKDLLKYGQLTESDMARIMKSPNLTAGGSTEEFKAEEGIPEDMKAIHCPHCGGVVWVE